MLESTKADDKSEGENDSNNDQKCSGARGGLWRSQIEPTSAAILELVDYTPFG